MVFASLHIMDGDPDDLLARKSPRWTPSSIVVPRTTEPVSRSPRTATGVVVFNLWDSAADAAAFSLSSEVIAAQAQSGLPRPSSFVRFDDVIISSYSSPDGGVSGEAQS